MKMRDDFYRPLDSVKRKRHPWYLVVPSKEGITVLTEYGEITTASIGEDAISLIHAQDGIGFTLSHKSLMAGTDPTLWTFKQRRQRVLEARSDRTGQKILMLPSGVFGEEWTTEQVCISFMDYLTWLNTKNVFVTARAGWSTLGRHLFLGSLSSPVRFFGITAARRAVLYGGRKSAPYPSRYKNAAKYDLRGAYAYSLGTTPLPRYLVPSRDPIAALRNNGDGIAFGVIEVPQGLRFPPLPQRADPHSVGILRWAGGVFSGWYTLNELRLAQSVGAKVSPVVAYEGRAYHQDFLQWFEWVQEGRQLQYGSKLAKHHANLLWSSFASSPSPILWKKYTADRVPVVVRRQASGPDFRGPTVYLSAMVAANQRIRLHNEALLCNGEERRTAVHVDTDGFIGAYSESIQCGPNLGDWRRVQSLPLVEIRSANAYRYRCTSCALDHAEWHYCVSGISSREGKERAFRLSPKGSEPIDLGAVVYS